jgi:hypothetical protein
MCSQTSSGRPHRDKPPPTTRLGTQDLLKDESCFYTNRYRIQFHVKARSYPKNPDPRRGWRPSSRRLRKYGQAISLGSLCSDALEPDSAREISVMMNVVSVQQCPASQCTQGRDRKKWWRQLAKRLVRPPTSRPSRREACGARGTCTAAPTRASYTRRYFFRAVSASASFSNVSPSISVPDIDSAAVTFAYRPVLCEVHRVRFGRLY